MARIFISYSDDEEELVNEYRSILQKFGHEVHLNNTSFRGANWGDAVLDEMSSSDCILVVALENLSFSIKNLVGEALSISSRIADNGRTLFIPLIDDVSRDEYANYSINNNIIEIGEGVASAYDVAQEIDERIRTFITERDARKEAPQEEEQSQSASPSVKEVRSGKIRRYPPAAFTRNLNNFLRFRKLGENIIGEWNYKGTTDIVYDTPSGGWYNKEGFLFESEQYSFVLRSIWDGGNDGEHSYLVIESNNLEGQLANVALDNAKKYVEEDGQVTIYETYSMTARVKKSYKVVKEAFKEVGMSSNVITTFKTPDVRWQNIIIDILRWAKYREEAKKLLLDPKRTNNDVSNRDGVNYWLLKANGGDWEGTKKVDDVRFSLRELDSFPVRVKQADKGVAYDYVNNQIVVFLFEVRGLLDLKRGHDLSINVTEAIVEPIPLDEFESVINFADELKSNEPPLVSLFHLEETAYHFILKLIEDKKNAPPELLYNSHSLSRISPDRVVSDTVDRLGFMEDVTALASVMAYKEVPPPLAIGLFGHWGTGKSFFMLKLQESIKKFSEDHQNVFCENVLQINFNSWHYSDSNLWASLITKIFEELETYGKDKPEEFKSLLKKLNSTKELLKKTKEEKRLVDNKIIELKKRKGIQDEDIKQKKEKLKTLKTKDIFHVVMENKSVKERVEKLNTEFPFREVSAQRDDIEGRLTELEGFGNQLREMFRLALHIGKTKAGFGIWFLVFLIIGALSLFVFFPDVITKYIDLATAKMASIVTVLTASITILRPYMTKVKSLVEKLKDVKKTIAKLEDKAEENIRAQSENISAKIRMEEAEAHDLQKEISLLEVKEEQLDNDLKDITSGAKIIKFIESRVTDERYVSSLGIISWVRKDFEELNKLLYEQKQAQAAQNIEKADGDTNFNLDRIILYIDDLDRCKEKTVVQVLEAIHLLLAFPLFVVVVGVDPRWMHNALNQQYEHLKKEENEDNESLETNGMATSYDYMEKIFQIPFTLKPMNKHGKHDLIEAQFEKVAKEKAEGDDLGEEGNETPVVAEDTPPTGSSGGKVINFDDFKDDEEDIAFTPTKRLSDDANIDRLEVSKEEVAFMKEISSLIGESPRTVKRYVNIYRIIRTHTKFGYMTGQQSEYYYGAMLLLSLMTGQPDIAAKLFDAVSNESETTLLLKDYMSNMFSEDELKDNALQQLISSITEDSKPALKILETLTIDHLKRNLLLVSRFSFRNLTSV